MDGPWGEATWRGGPEGTGKVGFSSAAVLAEPNSMTHLWKATTVPGGRAS